jgi:2-keto-4-pentenoate hydratase
VSTFEKAAAQLLPAWVQSQQILALDAGNRPQSRAEGYQVQQALFQAIQEQTCGWKIAATSVAGQKHIGVSGPLAGRLLESRRMAPGASVSLTGNVMRIMEAEFAFQLGQIAVEFMA